MQQDEKQWLLEDKTDKIKWWKLMNGHLYLSVIGFKNVLYFVECTHQIGGATSQLDAKNIFAVRKKNSSADYK